MLFIAGETSSLTPGEIGLIAFGLFLIVLVAVVIGAAIDCTDEAKRKVAEQERLREVERQEALRHKAALEAQCEKRRQEIEEQARASLASAIVQVRAAAEERLQRTITAEGMEGLDQKLREVQMIGSHIGRVLTVRVYCVPTGWVGIEWMLDPSLPTPLKVICRRNETIVFAECAYKGVWGDILPRGREFVFSFQAMEGKSDREDGLQFSITIPTEGEWNRKVNPAPPPPQTDDAAARREKIAQKLKALTVEDDTWEQGRRDGHKQIDATDATDADKKRRKARLDAQIARERDEEGG